MPINQAQMLKVKKDKAETVSWLHYKAASDKHCQHETRYWLVNTLSGKRSDRAYTLIEFFEAVHPDVRRIYKLYPEER